MNSGGIAAVLPSASVVTEESPIVPSGMTYADERLSERWKERRARFLGCIENTKLIAERTKQRQENARMERLKKERAEMEKYRRRYLEAAMKQYVEQQAKPREGPSALAQSHGHHHPQLLSPSQGYPGCMQVLRSGLPFAPGYQPISACKPNVRKRPFENSVGWTQYAHMAIMNDPHHMYPGKQTEMFQNSASPMQISNSLKYSNMMSKSVSHCPSSSYNRGPDEIERAEQYDQARLGGSMLPTTSQAQETVISTIPEEMNNLSTMPELAESHMKDLMEQIGPGNSLDDLGGNCLEGVLANRCDEHTGALESGTLQIQSANSSIISPISAPCGTPNSTLSPTHLSLSARCSTNSFYESQSAAVTPQQNLTPPCDQPQRISITSTLARTAPPVMAQENPLLCTRNDCNSTSSTSSIGSANAVPLTSSLIGSNNVNSVVSSTDNDGMYSNAAIVSTPVAVPSQLQQQEHYQFAQFQHYHHSRHQQQQLLNLFNRGYHMSTTSNTPLPHLDNARMYNGIEYPRFGHCYNHYSNHPSKSSIFPRFPSHTLVECSASQQYDVYAMKYPNSGMSYNTQQPEMNVQQQAYQFQVPLLQSTYHHYHGNGSETVAASQNPVYPTNHF